MILIFQKQNHYESYNVEWLIWLMVHLVSITDPDRWIFSDAGHAERVHDSLACGFMRAEVARPSSLWSLQAAPAL